MTSKSGESKPCHSEVKRNCLSSNGDGNSCHWLAIQGLSRDMVASCIEGQLVGNSREGKLTLEFKDGNQDELKSKESEELREVNFLYQEATKALMANEKTINVITSNDQILDSIDLLIRGKPLVRRHPIQSVTTQLNKKYKDFSIRLKQMNLIWSYRKRVTTATIMEDQIGNEESVYKIPEVNKPEAEETQDLSKPVDLDQVLKDADDAKEPERNNHPQEDKVICAIRTEGLERIKPCTIDDIRVAQSEDEECSKIKTELGESIVVSWDQKGIKVYMGADNLIRARGNIQLTKGELVLIDSIYVPKTTRGRIIGSEHSSKWATHPQYTQLCKAVLAHFYWPTFRSDIRRFTQSCDPCQKIREKRKKTFILDFDKPNTPWDMVAIDVIGPIFKSQDQNEYILSLLDIFTRYVTLIPIPNQNKETIVYAMESRYISRFGCPRTILSDNASNFCSSLFEEVCSILGVLHRRTPPWHPQGNGSLERSNREVKKKLTLLCANSSNLWDHKLHMAEFAINNSHNSSIGTSPSELLYGRRMRSPASCLDSDSIDEYIITSPYIESFRDRLDVIRKTAEVWEKKVRDKRNSYKNSKRNLIKYDINEEVLYKRVKPKGSRGSGFSFAYDGPFKVASKVSDVTYRIVNPKNLNDRVITAHSDRLKRYINTDVNTPHSIQEEDNGRKNIESNDEEVMVDAGDLGLLVNPVMCPVSEGDTIREERALTEDQSLEEIEGETNISGGNDVESSKENPAREASSIEDRETLADKSVLSDKEDEGTNRIRPCDLTSVEEHGEEDKGLGVPLVNHGYFTRSKGKVQDIPYSNYKFDRKGNITVVGNEGNSEGDKDVRDDGEERTKGNE